MIWSNKFQEQTLCIHIHVQTCMHDVLQNNYTKQTCRDKFGPKDLMHHFLLCIKSKNRMQHMPEHTCMIKDTWNTEENNFFLILYALIFRKTTRLHQHIFQFICVFSIPPTLFETQPPAKNSPRVGCHCLRWEPPVWRRRNPPSKTWDLSLRVRLFARGKKIHPGRLTAGTYKSPIWKGKWSSKPPSLWSMLIFQGVQLMCLMCPHNKNM